MPVESELLQPAALDYLNGIEAEAAAREADRRSAAARDELLAWCNQFLAKSQEWRLSSWEDDWHCWRRNAEAQYDPRLAALKKPWQSRAFIPLVPSHRETIQASLYKTMVGARPLLEVKPRGTYQSDQSQNIRDLILREMEKSRFETEMNLVLDDVTTYGSGFARVRYETKTETRMVRRPVLAEVDTTDPVAVQRALTIGPEVAGYEDTLQEVAVYRGVRFNWVSIWDVYPDPESLSLRGAPCALRYPITYGEVLAGINKGYFLPEAAEALQNVDDGDSIEDSTQQVRADRRQTPAKVSRPVHGRRLRCFELFARLPKKWVLWSVEPGADAGDPEELVPARVIFHKAALLSVEPSDEYDGEASLYKFDYMPVPGQFYARGIPEMLKDLQDVLNESVNQRLDGNSILLKRKFAVIEKALVDPADLDWTSDNAIRINAKYAQDVRQAFAQVDVKDLGSMAIIDPQEMERYAQERTSANRMTLGTAGQVKDANETLGGMQLLLGQAGEKFAYIGMLMEFASVKEVFRAFWRAIYSNIEPQDVMAALGPERARAFELLTPEQIEQDYSYEPQGIFEMTNKAMRQARLQAIREQFKGAPWLDEIAIFRRIAQAVDEDPDVLMRSPEETAEWIKIQAAMAQVTQPVPEQVLTPMGRPSTSPGGASEGRA